MLNFSRVVQTITYLYSLILQAVVSAYEYVADVKYRAGQELLDEAIQIFDEIEQRFEAAEQRLSEERQELQDRHQRLQDEIERVEEEVTNKNRLIGAAHEGKERVRQLKPSGV